MSTPLYTLALLDAPETVRFGGAQLAPGDLAFWRAPSDGATTLSAQACEAAAAVAAAPDGGIATLDASLHAAFTFASASAPALRLCYLQQRTPLAAWQAFDSVRLATGALTGPRATALLAGVVETYRPAGTGTRAGDSLFWVAAAGAQAACAAGGSSALGDYGGLLTLGAAGDGELPGVALNVRAAALGLQLCYRFQSRPGYSLFSNVIANAHVLNATRAGDARAVVMRPASVVLSGVGVADGDEAYWVPAATSSCAAAPPLAQYGGAQVVANGGANFKFARRTGAALGYKLCYRFQARSGYDLYPALVLLVAEVQLPLSSIATLGVAKAIAFAGAGLAAGDRAFWLRADAADCASSAAAVEGQVANRSASGLHTFTFATAASGLTLCYAFGAAGSTGELPFAHVPRAALTVAFPADPFASASFTAVVPVGAALRVETLVTIRGTGFEAAAAASPSSIKCSFDGRRATPVSLNATVIVCRSPAFTTTSTAVAVQLVSEETEASGAERTPVLVFAGFAAYDNAAVGVARLSPPGGPQGVATAVVTVEGSHYVDYGRLVVQFGTVGTVAASLPEQGVSILRATAPYVSPTAGASTRVAVRVSLDGQTFDASPLPLEYVFYSALVRSGAPAGAPLAAATLTLTGLGFLDLGAGAAICVFTSADGGSAPPRASAARVLGPTRATCAAPALAPAGAYTVTLSLNGGADIVPVQFDPILFRLYAPSEIAVARVQPAGGPTDGGTNVTVFGRGFYNFGPGQLCCVLADVLDASQAPGCTAVARLLANAADGLARAVCALPPSTVGRFGVEISLNGGVAGSVSVASGVSWTSYAPPTVLAIAPSSGDADGNGLVTITGFGFEAFQPFVEPPLGPASARARTAGSAPDALALRVRFGAVVATEPPLNYTDTTIVQYATWGLRKDTWATSTVRKDT